MAFIPSHLMHKPLPSFRRLASKVGSWLAMCIFVGTFALVLALNVYMETKRRDLNGARQALEIALQEKAVRGAQVKRVEAVKKMLESAASAGLEFSSWDERRFNIKQAVMSRDKANKLMTEVRRSKTSIFGAEQFEISVRGTEQSLFTMESKASELVVTLRGSLLFSRPN